MNILSHARKTLPLIFLVVSSMAAAQPGMGKYQQLYTQDKLQTVTGTVQSVDLVTPPGVIAQAVTLTLKTATETIPVQLGPESFVQRLETRIEKGDMIEVTGSRISVDGKVLMLAARIKKDTHTLLIRDNTGVPVWAGK
jgi:DNA helicase TIP49 (TBP-interacting protein)